MGGTFRRIIRKAVGEPLKALGVAPSKKEIAAKQKAAEQAAAQKAAEKKAADDARTAQMQTEVIDAPGNDPDDVIYAGEQGEGAPKKKKKKKSGTILTSTKGVMGDAPTESKTLLGG
jgi:membrane protein involved in colicin uptake